MPKCLDSRKCPRDCCRKIAITLRNRTTRQRVGGSTPSTAANLLRISRSLAARVELVPFQNNSKTGPYKAQRETADPSQERLGLTNCIFLQRLDAITLL